MKELTPEQLVIKILKDRLPIDMHHYQYQELAEEILTANTEPEDECICNLDPDDTCPVKIFNEDCPIHGYEYEEVDGWVICPGCGREIHLPFPNDNQITLRKWKKFYNEYLKQDKITHFFQFPDWLQQEDK